MSLPRHGPLLTLLALAVIGVVYPLAFPQLLSIAIFLLLLGGWATAWDLLGGWAGQSSLGHAAFVGLGAYSLAVLASRFEIAPWWGAVLGMVLAAALAFGWGKLTFRLRGPYFTLSTIAVAEILRLVAIEEAWLTSGAEGIFIFSLAEPFGLDLFDRQVEYFLALGYLLLVLGTTMVLAGRRFGYQLRAVREDEAAAEAAGIDPGRTKLLAFMLSAALTALGGAVYGVYLSYLEPHDLFFLPLSVQIALTAIIGGRGTIFGPLTGAVLLVIAGELFRNAFAEANLLIYGVLIVVVVVFLPRGILGNLRQRAVRRRYARSLES